VKAKPGYQWLENVVTRIHLPVIKGGLGIASIDNIRRSAYMGSILLVSQLIKKFCPEFTDFVANNPNDTSNFSVNMLRLNLVSLQAHLSEAKLDPAFAENLNPSYKVLEELTMGNLFNESYTKMQHHFTSLSNELIARDLIKRYKRYQNEDDKAILSFFISCADEHTGDWLLPHHGIKYNKLTDTEFIFCVKLRIGARFNYDHGTKRCKVENCKGKIGPGATHAFSNCAALKALVKSRHDDVVHAIHKCARNAGLRTKVEPMLRNYFNSKPTVPTRAQAALVNPSQRRGDVFIHDREGNSDSMIDVTIVAPTSIETSGSRLETALKNKIDSYNADFDTTSCNINLKIFAMESSGLLSNSAIDVIKYIARSQANNSDVPNAYSNIIKYIYQRIAVANQRGNAALLMAYTTQCCGLRQQFTVS